MADIDLKKDIDQIKAGLDKLYSKLELIARDVEEQKVDIEKLDHTINGNGKQGLKQDVAYLAAASHARNGFANLTITIVSVVIAGVFGILAFIK